MRHIDLLPGAQFDLQALRRKDRAAAAFLMVVLQEADADPRLLNKLTTHGDIAIGPDGTIVNVKGWVTARRSNHNLFRLKSLDPPASKYRVIYGFDWRTRRIGVLALVRKDESTYETNSALGRRILADWRTATGGADT
jgi:mRNA-degrading endonuclease RelE of RelBE toxin-antitoxin system